jgi:hypothetical protein
MSKRMVFSALLALVLVAAVVAPVAAAMKFCFTLNGKVYCFDIPVEVNIMFKVPPDTYQEALDVATVLDSFKAIYRSDPSPTPWLRALVEDPTPNPWLLVSPDGKYVVALDMVQKAAIEIEAETKIGY